MCSSCTRLTRIPSPTGQQQDGAGAEEQSQNHFEQNQIAAGPVRKPVDLHPAMEADADHGEGKHEEQVVEDDEPPGVELGGVVLH